MSYYQIISEERHTISTLRKQRYSVDKIAKYLQRHRGSIYRELKRNKCNDGRYRVSKACSRTRNRRSVSRRNCHFSDQEFQYVKDLLLKKWSPEQISGYLKRIGGLSISHETIYQYVWADKAKGGSLYIHLRCTGKKRRKRYGAYDSRGRLAEKKHISERAESIEERKYLGHWEIDTVMGEGSKDCIVTLVERKSGFVQIGKLKNHTKKELNQRTIKLIRNSDPYYRTITADNGTEFHGYKEIEKKTGVVFYFATPYHSWERGTSENTNGLIRQYLPKRTSMAKINQQHCRHIANQLNSRPRKRLGYKTPVEVMYEN
jgi:transposase, IS30 family